MPPKRQKHIDDFYRKRTRTSGEYLVQKGKSIARGAAVGGAIGGVPGAVGGAVEGVFESAGPSDVYEKVDASRFRKKNYNMSKMSVRRKSKSKGKGKKPIKRNSKRVSRNKRKRMKKRGNNINLKTLQKKGISVSYEKRKAAKTAGSEALFVGHTSMPSKLCAINMWRAIFKYFFLKAGIYLKDYGSLLTDIGLKVGDIIRVNYYTSSTATAVTAVSHTITATNTFDYISYTFCNYYAGKDVQDVVADRLDSVEYIPYEGTTFATASTMARTNVEINNLKITVSTASLLKIQNVTVEVAADNEADDVNRVPLVGKTFVTKGNNVMKKINSAIIPGFFATNNDDAIYSGWTRQVAAVSNDFEFYDQTTIAQTVFTKPAEIPKKHEFANCESEAFCKVGPGDIVASNLKAYYTFGVNWYFKLLYGAGSTKVGQMVYDSRLGKTKGFYLEKLVGRSAVEGTNDISLLVELEVKQSCMVHGPYGQYTVPIQYQIDYPIPP